MPGRMEFDFQFRSPTDRPGVRRRNEGPMRILVLGDFSGRRDRKIAGPGDALSGRPILEIDVDNFERVFRRLSPRLDLEWPAGGPPPVSIAPDSLDSFHPDHLYQGLEVFRALREIRRQVLEPGPAEPSRAAAGGTRASGSGSGEDDRAMLERLLGRAEAPNRGPGIDITPFLRRIVEPYIVPGRDPRLPDLLASLDEATTGQMRAVLHHAAFQALESSWRGLHWLTTGLETGEHLSLHVLDVTRGELESDLQAAGGTLEASALFRLLAGGEEGSRESPLWSLLVGDYTFGDEPREVELLGALGSVAARTRGPFLAGADPRILGCLSLADTPDPRDWTGPGAEASPAWQSLRRGPWARFIGLAIPRILLRRPYGRGCDEIERFAFEEMPAQVDHESFLWGNPAFACALLLGRTFLERGWAMDPGDDLDLTDLPVHTYVEAGERRMTPCAEALLTERAAEAILDRGLMPLLSRREANSARLVRFQSVADPPAALSGPWS